MTPFCSRIGRPLQLGHVLQVGRIRLCAAAGEASSTAIRISATERRALLRHDGGGLGGAVCNREGGRETELTKRAYVRLRDHQGKALTRNDVSYSIERRCRPNVLYHSVHTRDDGRWVLVSWPITFPFFVCVANYIIILWILTNLAIADWVCRRVLPH
jgi:hypothetical protein